MEQQKIGLIYDCRFPSDPHQWDTERISFFIWKCLSIGGNPLHQRRPSTFLPGEHGPWMVMQQHKICVWQYEKFSLKISVLCSWSVAYCVLFFLIMYTVNKNRNLIALLEVPNSQLSRTQTGPFISSTRKTSILLRDFNYFTEGKYFCCCLHRLCPLS